MECQDLFSFKKKKKCFKISSAAVLVGAVRVNSSHFMILLSVCGITA